MRKWKKYLAAVLAAVLTVGSMQSAIPQSAKEVQAAELTTETTTIQTLGGYNTVWKYLDDNTDPASGQSDLHCWTAIDFDDSEWKVSSGQSKFGAKSGKLAAIGTATPTILLNQYIDGQANPNIPAYFFRTEFTVDKSELSGNVSLSGTFQYDDGIIVYLNGEKIGSCGATADITESSTTNLYYGGDNSGAGDPAEVTFTVDAAKLKNGKNVLAVEIHQAGTTSSDVYFSMSSLTLEQGSAVTLPLDYNTTWKYLDDNTDPAGDGDRTCWTLAGYDDSSWKTNEGLEAKFGAKNGAISNLGNDSTPTVLLNQYINGTSGNDVTAYFFRTTFEVDSIPEGAELKGILKYDDAVIIYLNGEKIASFDEPDGGFSSNLSYGGSNAGDPIDATFTISADKLNEGTNVLAVELHQGRASSSDVYFEMSSLRLTDPDETGITQKEINLTVGSDETSRNITWYANTEETGIVQYAKKNGEEFPSDYTEVQATVIQSNDSTDGTFYSNKATLEVDYDTEYVYRVINGAEVSEVYSFKTGTEGDFSFLLVGDPQIGASGNATNDAANWDTTLTTAINAFPDSAFLLSAGDQVNTASSETEYEGYLEHDVLKSLPTATVIGNHDSGSSSYSQHYNNPNVSSYGTTTAGSDYWFVYNNVLVMSLNSNATSTDSIAEHKAFMKEAIEANPDVEWKVVTFHHSIYSAASHAVQNDILTRRSNYVPVFTELDIDVVLMGHDHVYVRSYMMDGFTPVVTDEVESSVTNPDDEILYVTVNSASGSKYYNITADYEYSAVQNQERTPNFSNVEVTDNSFKITTYRTSDLSVVDEFTIYRETETTKTEEAEENVVGFDNEDAVLEITKTAEYDSGVENEDGGTAEIVQYNSDNQMYYVVNGTTGTLDIVPREVYTENNNAEGFKFNLKVKLKNYRTDFEYGDMTSVAVNTEKDLIAIAVQAKETDENGLIVLMNYDNEIVAVIDAGVQPDMVTFTEDGTKVLSANEGEPRDGYDEDAVDPMGSITIADLSNGTDSITVKNITFEDWDSKRDELTASGVIIKKNTAPSVDFEPEYIAVNSDGTKAYVSLQEANAIATIDITTGTVTSIKSLGFKDHSQEENALDITNDSTINIKTEDVYGIYMPDGIAVYEVNGIEYLITANEGDSREWGDYSNEIKVKINGSKVTTFDTSGYDGVDETKTYIFGGRSFAIYNAETMEQIYESGSDFETITAKYLADYFNCSNNEISMDGRSPKKGPEAESVVVGEVDGRIYAFIGLERISGVMVYDITDLTNVSYVNYINSRDFSGDIEGDVSPEGLCFVPASESLSGNPELIVANEVSGTVAVYEIKTKAVDNNENPKDDEEQNTDNQDDEEQNDDNQNSDDVQSNGNEETSSGADKVVDSNDVAAGDNSNIWVWVIAVFTAGTGVFVIAYCKNKRRKEQEL